MARLRQVRQQVAAEAARIIATEGQHNYHAAKKKAAERIGISERLALPSNIEVKEALRQYQSLYGGSAHQQNVYELRRTAVSAMQMLGEFKPRLVGPVLHGTADANSAVNLHVFADSPEAVAYALAERGLNYRPYERRLRSRRDQFDTYAGFEFQHAEAAVQATVFPIDGIRQAPISPVDGKPMKRADEKAVRELLD